MDSDSACLPNGGIPFRRSTIEVVVPQKSGIYVFWSKRFCLYVGKADVLRERLLRHWVASHNPDLRLWIRAHGSKLSVTYKLVESDLQNAEQSYIDMLSPHLNKINAKSK